MKNIYISIILILILLILINKNKEHFIELTDDAYRSKFIENLSKFIGAVILNQNNITINKVKNSNKLIISNITPSKYIKETELYIRKLNYNLLNNQLDYFNIGGEHKTNIFSSYYISKGIITKPDNLNYGYLINFEPDTEYNNYAEICIDFYKNKENELNKIKNINNLISKPLYKNITRKSVNIYTALTAPPEFIPYFNKGDDDKDIELICVFYDQTNLDFINTFPEGKFNILTNDLSYVLQECEIDKPYCGIGLDSKGKILGRDKYVSGRFNPKLNKYVILDSPEYSKYKEERKKKGEKESKINMVMKLNKILEELETQIKSYYELEEHEKVILQNNNKLRKYQDLELKKIDIKIREGLSWENLKENEVILISDLGLMDKYGIPKSLSGSAPNESFTGSYYVNKLLNYTNKKYENMHEHFSNEIEGKFKNKYLEYDNYKTCINKENYDKKLKNYIQNQYSIVHSDDEILTNGKEAIKKMKKLNGFKCRKSGLDSDTRYYYGGLDIDNKMKCYGSNGECFIYRNENECKKMEKDIFKIEEDFVGNINYNLFNRIEYFNVPNESDYEVVEISATESFLDEKTYNTGEFQDKKIGETIKIENKNNHSLDYIEYSFKGRDQGYGNNSINVAMLKIRFNDKTENDISISIDKRPKSLKEDKSLFDFNKIKKIEDMNLTKFENISFHVYSLGSGHSVKEIKDLKVKLYFKNTIRTLLKEAREARNSAIQAQQSSELARDASKLSQTSAQQSVIDASSKVKDVSTAVQEAANRTEKSIQSKITDSISNAKNTITSTVSDTISDAKEKITESESKATESISSAKDKVQKSIKQQEDKITGTIKKDLKKVKDMEIRQKKQIILDERKKDIEEKKKKKEKRIAEAKKQDLISKKQETLSNLLQSKDGLIEFDPYDEFHIGYVGSDFVNDFEKYNSLDCIKNYKIKATCKHNVDGRMVDIITFKKSLVNLDPKSVISNNQILELNKNFLLDNPSEEDILKEKEIKYLIEPYNKDFKDIHPGIIFNSFKYKIRIVNSYAIIDNKEELVSVIEIYEDNKFLGIMKENNESNSLVLKKNDKIHIFIDKKNKFNVMIYDNNLFLKSQFLSEKTLEGEFGKELNLYLRQNNRKVFGGISLAEKLKQMVYPYNPFLNVTEV